MSKNIKGTLALIILIALGIGLVVYGYKSGHHVAAIAGIIFGLLIMLLSLLVRKPGAPTHKPNTAIYASFGAILPSLLYLFGGDRLKDQVGVFTGGMLCSLGISILIFSLIYAHNKPGYWRR